MNYIYIFLVSKSLEYFILELKQDLPFIALIMTDTGGLIPPPSQRMGELFPYFIFSSSYL